MEYLPSKNFLSRALILFLLFGGWIYFSDSNITSKKEGFGTIEKKDGILVFSKNRKENGLLPDLSKGDKWDIEGGEDETFSLNNSLLTSQNTAGLGLKNEYSIPAFKPHKLSDLNIIYDEDTKTLQKYARDLVSALKPYSLKELPNEGYLAIESIKDNVPENLEKISVMSQIHKVVSETLLKMKTPKELASRHLDLINYSSKLSYIDSKLTKSYENPSSIISVANEFKKASEGLIFSINNINLFFKDKGLEFEPDQQIDVYVNTIR